jgi:hypothetical protein
LPTPFFAGQQPTEAECFAVSFGLFPVKDTIFTENLYIFSTIKRFLLTSAQYRQLPAACVIRISGGVNVLLRPEILVCFVRKPG